MPTTKTKQKGKKFPIVINLRLFRARVQDQMRLHDLGFPELAVRTKMSSAALSQAVNRGHRPGVVMLVRLAGVFDVSIDYLCGLVKTPWRFR